MTTRADPKPPTSLGKAGREFWRSVLAAYVLEEGHHLRLLENAALCLDRAAAARVQLATDGIVTKNRFGEVVAHPAANIERQSMTLFRQNLRELGLDVDGSPAELRGPRRPGTRN